MQQQPSSSRPEPSPFFSSGDSEEQCHKDRVWMGRAARLFCLCIGAWIAILLIRYVLPCLLPFLAAWLLSGPIRRGARVMERRLSWPRRLSACLLLLAVLLPLGSLCVLFVEHLAAEAQQMLLSLGGGEQILSALEKAMQTVREITGRIPLISHLAQHPALDTLRTQWNDAAVGMITEALTHGSMKMSEWLSGTVRRFPAVLIFILTFFITLFYCCTDDGRISQLLHDIVPPLWRPRWQEIRQRAVIVGVKYLRAYLLLFALTLGQLLIGFSLLGLEYIFLPALLISLLDILPILGVGTFLIPWGVLALLTGNTSLGTGLLILCAAMLLIRQLLESRIIGGSIGLHPLATLLAIYAGLRLAGIWGMVLAPLVAVLIKSVIGKEAVRH